jgi:hypothetical protein
MTKGLILGVKYTDKEDGRDYEITGIKEENGKKIVMLARGVARQEIDIDDFWKVFKTRKE